MKLRSLNNATMLLESGDSVLLIDPWIVGDLYHGAWSPVVKMNDLDFLNSVTHVFISHLHEDHWDRKTLELLDKDTIIFIPNIQPINKVLKNLIEELGFFNIKFIDFFSKEKLGNLQITVVPPMNVFGQDLGSYYKDYEMGALNVDTSLLVEDSLGNTAHLFLCDNTPYDLKVISEFTNLKLTSLWYPFNSYAQDYPVCYNLKASELEKIHDEMHIKRKEAIRKCVQFVKPQYYFPHSADFVLNGLVSKKFNNYIRKEFMDRKSVALNYTFSDLEYSSSEYALFGDVIDFDSSGEMKIKRNQFQYENINSKLQLKKLLCELNGDISVHIKKAFQEMLRRSKNFNVDISNLKDWVLTIKTEKNEYNFSYNSEKLLETIDEDNIVNRLIISLTEEKLAALLTRELHWNNAQLGYQIDFRRIPNIYCQELYNSLNFLHI
tara:strand:- start:143 stop:1450 length:1308 start_codon:yes stop_codon:yes gene_type:complete